MLKILALVLVTFIPALELRASIPLGILSGKAEIFGLTLQGFGLNFILVFIVCIISNIILGILVYFFLDKFVKHLMKFKLFAKYYARKVKKTQRKIEPYIKKYGTFGMSLFIGLPLPGSGSYTGALGAYLIGLGYKKFIIANIVGVVIAGILVTVLTLTGVNLLKLN
ncbi:MAG: small multi-drug export protein [Omnitrophica bacterium]|nr:small multi-drug export protein [Candidatus Omnitrophota bacterium]